MMPVQMLLVPVWFGLLAGSVALYINEESAPLVGKPIAFLTDRKGLVEFRGPDFSVWSKASANQGFIQGTTVATSSGATARILIGSDLVLNVSESSQVVIGDSSELKPDRELHVSVLRGELKLDAGENISNKQANTAASSPMLANLPKPSSVVIETGSVSARVKVDSETELSVLKELGKPAVLAALKGGAIVQDSAEGTTRVIGDVPKPSGLLSFVLPVMNRSEVALDPPPLRKQAMEPEPIIDPKGVVE